MNPLTRAHLNAVDYAIQRAAFYGRECAISMQLGHADLAYERAALAHRWAVESGRVAREPERQEQTR